MSKKFLDIRDQHSKILGHRILNSQLSLYIGILQLLVCLWSLAQHFFSIMAMNTILHCDFSANSTLPAAFTAVDAIIFDVGLFHALWGIDGCVAQHLDGGYGRFGWCITHSVALMFCLPFAFASRPKPYYLWPLLIQQSAYGIGLLILSLAALPRVLPTFMGDLSNAPIHAIFFYTMGTLMNFFLLYIYWHWYWYVESMWDSARKIRNSQLEQSHNSRTGSVRYPINNKYIVSDFSPTNTNNNNNNQQQQFFCTTLTNGQLVNGQCMTDVGNKTDVMMNGHAVRSPIHDSVVYHTNGNGSVCAGRATTRTDLSAAAPRSPASSSTASAGGQAKALQLLPSGLSAQQVQGRPKKCLPQSPSFQTPSASLSQRSFGEESPRGLRRQSLMVCERKTSLVPPQVRKLRLEHLVGAESRRNSGNASSTTSRSSVGSVTSDSSRKLRNRGAKRYGHIIGQNTSSLTGIRPPLGQLRQQLSLGDYGQTATRSHFPGRRFPQDNLLSKKISLTELAGGSVQPASSLPGVNSGRVHQGHRTLPQLTTEQLSSTSSLGVRPFRGPPSYIHYPHSHLLARRVASSDDRYHLQAIEPGFPRVPREIYTAATHWRQSRLDGQSRSFDTDVRVPTAFHHFEPVEPHHRMVQSLAHGHQNHTASDGDVFTAPKPVIYRPIPLAVELAGRRRIPAISMEPYAHHHAVLNKGLTHNTNNRNPFLHSYSHTGL